MNNKDLEKAKKELPDVQQTEDIRNKRINKVGIRELIIPIKIMEAKDNVRNTVGNISIYVSLSQEQKGTSMSRLVEVVHDVLEENVISSDIIRHILVKLREVLGAEDSYVKLHFTYFAKRKAPVSEKEGYINIPCSFEGKNFNGEDKIYLRVKHMYTSCCPCSRDISDSGAHNQRSVADILVELKGRIKIEELIAIVDKNASCEMYSILKRPDEKYVTEKAYNNPKFVEDVVRDIALDMDTLLDNQISDYVVVINHFESIHQHEAVAIINAGRNLK